MTLEQIKASNKPFLKPADLVDVLGSNAQTIRMSARLGLLGFPVTIMGSRVKIPRVPFLQFIGEAGE